MHYETVYANRNKQRKKAFDECRVSSFFMFINLALHPFTQGNLYDFQMLACVVYSVSKATRH